MIDVSIRYRPVSFIPFARNIETAIPSRWAELNDRQLKAVARLSRSGANENDLLAPMLGISDTVSRRLGSYQAFSILKNLIFVKDLQPVSSFIIREVAGLRAPEDRLKGVTFGAFIFGDTYFQSYLKGKKEDLSRFIACFYTGPDGFSETRIESSAAVVRRQDPETLEAIALNYKLIREWLARAYPYVFEKSESDSGRGKSKGWIAVFDAVVGDDVANDDKYAQKPLSTILRYLNRKTKDYYRNGITVQRPR